MKTIKILVGITVFILLQNNTKAQTPSLSVGDNAPVFTAVDEAGIPWSLKNHLGEKTIVLYFYPAALTGGCTKQACAYRDMLKQFDDNATMIVGISGDNAENLDVFRKSHQLNFTLLSDTTGGVAKLYGVPTKEGGTITREIDGKEVELSRDITLMRWTFIIDKEGKIIYIDNNVNAQNDSKQVFDFLQSNIP